MCSNTSERFNKTSICRGLILLFSAIIIVVCSSIIVRAVTVKQSTEILTCGCSIDRAVQCNGMMQGIHLTSHSLAQWVCTDSRDLINQCSTINATTSCCRESDNLSVECWSTDYTIVSISLVIVLMLCIDVYMIYGLCNDITTKQNPLVLPQYQYYDMSMYQSTGLPQYQYSDLAQNSGSTHQCSALHRYTVSPHYNGGINTL
jgi:hypothetical protein